MGEDKRDGRRSVLAKRYELEPVLGTDSVCIILIVRFNENEHCAVQRTKCNAACRQPDTRVNYADGHPLGCKPRSICHGPILPNSRRVGFPSPIAKHRILTLKEGHAGANTNGMIF